MNPYCMQSPVSHSVLISVLCVCVCVHMCACVLERQRKEVCAFLL